MSQTMEFINIVGGIVLILFGLRYLRKGFARILGSDLVDWLQQFTTTRIKAFTGGIIAGTVMPSSTAMAFLSVQMTREGKVTFTNVLAVLLGAQVGITVLVQVLSLNLQPFATVLLAAGGLLHMYFGAQKVKGYGQILLAMAFLFLGMGIISSAARAIGADPAIVELFAVLGKFPILLFMGSLVLTMLIQSSTASIAVALGLAVSGQVTLPMLLLWVLGTNIGMCATVLAAGWSRTEGRRLGIAILLIKLPLALIGFLLIQNLPATFWPQVPGTHFQQGAWAHTLFNVLGIIGLPFAARLERWVSFGLPQAQEEVKAQRLDSMLQQHPSLGINAALRETLKTFDWLHVLRADLFQCLQLRAFSPHTKDQVAQKADAILELRVEVVRFLDGIADDDLDKYDRILKETMDDLMRELPVMVRTFQRDMLRELQKLIEKHPEALPIATPLLNEAAQRCAQQMEIVARMLMQYKPELGQEILKKKHENSSWMIAIKRSPNRLPDPVWEIIDDFQQLNRRLAGVAYVFCQDQPSAAML